MATAISAETHVRTRRPLDGLVETFPPRRIFLFALASALFQILFSGGFGFGSGWETVAIARELVRTGTFGNPFEAGPSGATAVIPPLFPFYLAVLLKLLGDGAAFVKIAGIAGMLAQAAAAALLPRVSAVFFGDSRPGVFAGILCAFALPMMPQWDAPFTTCALLLFFVYSSVAALRRGILSGAAAGLLVLLNPATVVVTWAWIAYLAFRRRTPPTTLAAFILAFGAVLAPWIIRNERVLGTFAIKDNFGMTAYASNNDCAEPTMEASMRNGCHDAHHPNRSARELRLLNAIGEARYDQVRTATTRQWIQLHPGAFLRLTAARIVEFWFPTTVRPSSCAAAIWLATIASFPGLILLFRKRPGLAWHTVAVLTVYPLPYYIVISDVRYRYPVLWVSALCAGYFITWMESKREPTGA